MRTTPPLPKPRHSVGWGPAVCVAALLLSLVLMHGFGVGHEAHSASVTSSSAPIGHEAFGAPSAGAPHSVEAPGWGLAGASGPVTGSSPDDPGKTTRFAQMCLAVLALVSLVAFVLVRALPRAHPQPSRSASRKSVRAFDRPPWLAPDIHALCVMRI